MSLSVKSSMSSPPAEKMAEPYTLKVFLENQTCQIQALSIQIFSRTSREKKLNWSSCRYSNEGGGIFTLDMRVLKANNGYVLHAVTGDSKKCVFHGKWTGTATYLLKERVVFAFPQQNLKSSQTKKPLTLYY